MLVKGVVAVHHIPSWATCYHHSLPKNAAMKRGRGRILDASRRGMSHKKGWATKRTSHKKGWATKRKEFFCNNDGESFCFCFENTMRTTSYSQTVSLLSCSCLPCLLVIGNSGHLLCCSLLLAAGVSWLSMEPKMCSEQRRFVEKLDRVSMTRHKAAGDLHISYCHLRQLLSKLSSPMSHREDFVPSRYWRVH